MPLVLGHRGKRVDTDIDASFFSRPKPVFLNQDRVYGRERRANDRTASNMILADSERIVNNKVDKNAHKWENNGFQGHVQFVGYFGRERIRPGIKMERDMQMRTFPMEMAKPLNTSQMLNPDTIGTECKGAPLDPRHGDALDTLKKSRSAATFKEIKGNHFHFDYPVLGETGDVDIGHMRAAGRASIMPSLGTAGKQKIFKHLSGKESLNVWRENTPFAVDAHHDKVVAPPPDAVTRKWRGLD